MLGAIIVAIKHSVEAIRVLYNESQEDAKELKGNTKITHLKVPQSTKVIPNHILVDRRRKKGFDKRKTNIQETGKFPKNQTACSPLLGTDLKTR